MHSFYQKLLEWYDQHQRDLPWRETKETYKVWLSEIILQQTRVEQGLQYYLRFVETYPSVEDLARASEDEVLKLWEGLGYYSRGRNLLATAKIVASDYKGKFPRSATELAKLKGIGPYTSAAISSIANGEKIAAVDGNAFRVLSRYFDIDLDIVHAKTRTYFEKLMTELIEGDRPGDFNQAVMDLGASVCTPKKYNCLACPLNDGCMALEKGCIDERPVKSKKIKIKDRFLHFLLIHDQENIALERREKGIWKGLYQFPLLEMKENTISSQQLKKELDFPVAKVKRIHSLDKPHKLSHQNLFITFWELETESVPKNHSRKKLEELSFPKPLSAFISDYFSD